MLQSRNVVGYPIPRNRLTVYNRPHRRAQSLEKGTFSPDSSGAMYRGAFSSQDLSSRIAERYVFV